MTDPIDLRRLVADLTALDLCGRSVLVHCSLRRVGPVVGGAATVASALWEVLGEGQTVVVPAQTPNNSTTSHAFQVATQGMAPEEVAAFEKAMPGFDPASTPSFGMGAFAEYIRTRPGAVRSLHPQASFAALGPLASAWMAVHDLDCHVGERSPLGALYRSDAFILLLGVGYEACTALHLAEYRLPWAMPVQRYRCYLQVNGDRRLCEFDAPRPDASDFTSIGAALDAMPCVRMGTCGNAPVRAFPLRTAVDVAVVWMSDHRR